MENNFPNMENSEIDWNDLKFFLAVARKGGLSAAATMLGTSPSTVSRHVAALEARLGTKLFLRQQTGYLLTDEGAQMFKHIVRVESAMLGVERNGRLASNAPEISGLVRVATTEILASHLLTPHLASFRKQYPKVRVELIIGLTQANLSRREADLALRLVDPSTHEKSQDYIAHRIGLFHFGLYCAKNVLDDTETAYPDAWRALDYISWDETWTHLPMAQWLGIEFPGKQPIFTSNSLNSHLAATRAGLGVALLPCMVADDDPELRRLISREPVISRELWLVYHRDLKASQRVAAMRNYITELVRTHLVSPP